jgi:hypothetical protein
VATHISDLEVGDGVVETSVGDGLPVRIRVVRR